MTAMSALLEGMVLAAQAAGESLEQAFGREPESLARKSGPADLVSAADLRSEAILRDLLGALHPEFGFLGEESGLVPGRDAEHVWIVDPLDGTTNFLVGMPSFAVNVALVASGVPIAGVTFAPLLEELFCAERGRGATLNGRPVRVSTRQELDQAVLGVGIPFHGKPRQAQFHAEMQRLTPRVAGIRRVGAGALDMAYVACGRYDAYWEQSVKSWDMAAGVVLVREAGGSVTDTAGRPLELDNGTVLACTPQLLPTLLGELRPT